MNDVTIVILGATGDLAKRKLLPALYKLIGREKLEKFLIVGAAIEETNAQQVVDQAKPFINGVDDAQLKKIVDSFFYQQLNFENESDFASLTTFVSSLEKEHGMSGNRLVYLAAAAEFFCPITKYIATSKLVVEILFCRVFTQVASFSV